MLIYLEREITPEAVGATFSSRGEAWTAYAIEVMTNCPYSHHRNLTGLSGALTVLEVYRTLVHDLMSQSVLLCLALERCSEDWSACHQRIAAFLGL